MKPQQRNKPFATAWILAACLSAACLTGCGKPFRTMAMGQVGLQNAFIQARSMLARQYRIIHSDSDDHYLETAWKYETDEPRDGMDDTAQVLVRRAVVLTLRLEKEIVWADIRVERQKRAQPGYANSYRLMEEMAHKQDAHLMTPATSGGPYTPEQEMIWLEDGCDEKQERVLLDTLYRRLNRKPLESSSSRDFNRPETPARSDDASIPVLSSRQESILGEDCAVPFMLQQKLRNEKTAEKLGDFLVFVVGMLQGIHVQ